MPPGRLLVKGGKDSGCPVEPLRHIGLGTFNGGRIPAFSGRCQGP